MLVPGLEPGTIYDVRVRARNAEGWSEWSDESMMETLPPPPPDPPQWRIWHVTHSSVTLCWSVAALARCPYAAARCRPATAVPHAGARTGLTTGVWRTETGLWRAQDAPPARGEQLRGAAHEVCGLPACAYPDGPLRITITLRVLR